MTQPDPSNATPPASGQGHLGELATGVAIALLLSHALAGEHLEHAAARHAVAPVRAAASGLTAWVAREWVSRFGSLTAPIDPVQWAALQPDITQRLRAVQPASPADTLRDYAVRAQRMGTRQGAQDLAVKPPDTLPLPVSYYQWADTAAEHITKRYDAAERLLGTQPVTTHADVVTALAPTHAAGSDVERDARTLVNTALNQGLHDVADQHAAELLWVSEKDACVVCAALSGTVVGTDEDFPADATFGRNPTSWWQPEGHVGPLRPPRHPRCRCRCEPWFGHAGPPGSLTLPQALKREAKRAVILGWALESEPDSVRRDAAARLLAKGTSLPKSVVARAKRRVASDGKFKRPVPTGDGK